MKGKSLVLGGVVCALLVIVGSLAFFRLPSSTEGRSEELPGQPADMSGRIHDQEVSVPRMQATVSAAQAGNEWHGDLFRILRSSCSEKRIEDEYAALATNFGDSGARLLLEDLVALHLPQDSKRAIPLLRALLLVSPTPGIGLERNLLTWIRRSDSDSLRRLSCEVLLKQESIEGRTGVVELAIEKYQAFLGGRDFSRLNAAQNLLTDLAEARAPEAIDLCRDVIEHMPTPDDPRDDPTNQHVGAGTDFASTPRADLVLGRKALAILVRMETPESIDLLRQISSNVGMSSLPDLVWEAVGEAISGDPSDPLVVEFGEELSAALRQWSPGSDESKFRAALTWASRRGEDSLELLLALEAQITRASGELYCDWAQAVAGVALGGTGEGATEALQRFAQSGEFPTQERDSHGKARSRFTEALCVLGTESDRQQLFERASAGDHVVAEGLVRFAPDQMWSQDLGRLEVLLQVYERDLGGTGTTARERAFSKLVSLAPDREAVLGRYDGTEDYRGKNIARTLRESAELEHARRGDPDLMFSRLFRGLSSSGSRPALTSVCKEWVLGHKVSRSTLVELFEDPNVAAKVKLVALESVLTRGSTWSLSDREAILAAASESCFDSPSECHFWCLVVLHMSSGPHTWACVHRVLAKRREDLGTETAPEVMESIQRLCSFLEDHRVVWAGQ